jgi:hypothetical protein
MLEVNITSQQLQYQAALKYITAIKSHSTPGIYTLLFEAQEETWLLKKPLRQKYKGITHSSYEYYHISLRNIRIFTPIYP